MNMDERLELIASLEGSICGTKLLDEWVMLALGWEKTWVNYPSDPPGLKRDAFKKSEDGIVGAVMMPTQDLTHGLSLIPKGFVWHVDASSPEDGIDWVLEPQIGDVGPQVMGQSKCVELALCAALVKLVVAQSGRPEPSGLELAILASHPSGAEAGADPVKVLETLAREWLEAAHFREGGVPATVDFWDDAHNRMRQIEWEIGEASVRTFTGYHLSEFD